MNSLLPHVARAMRARNLLIRFSPVDYIPIEERRRIVEKSLVHIYRIAHGLGFDLGGVPTLVSRGDHSFDPARVLEDLANLHVDVLGAHHILGTADVAQDAVEGVLDQAESGGRHVPDFSAMVDDAKNPDLKGLHPTD